MKVEFRPKGAGAGTAWSALDERVAVDAASAKAGRVAFNLSTQSLAYLVDHGFQDMTVLPGAFYVVLAVSVHVESLRAMVGQVRRVEFRNPLILTAEMVNLSVGFRWVNERTVHYDFTEVNSANTDAATGLVYAELEIELPSSLKSAAPTTDFAVKTFQQRAVYLGDQTTFYRRLHDNGNEYGPHFQTLRDVWQVGEEALGRLQLNRNILGTDQHDLDPIFIDGISQLLSAFHLDQGRTFILKGIEEVTLIQPGQPEVVWVHARLRPKANPSETERVGDLEVFDESGALRFILGGVRFAYLERSEAQENAGKAKTKVVIAATFTAEPVEDSLRFWSDQLDIPIAVHFAPYNQVFQELLNPASELRRNHDGVNVILLNLDDWAAVRRSGYLQGDLKTVLARQEGLQQHQLPNGLEVAHLNRHETEYVFKEIFEDQCYLRHGIRLAADATVIDIGANIGLFSLFVRSRCPQASVYAFEPSPIAFRALQANCEAYGPRLHPFNVGVSERRGFATLTFYEKSSVFSSFHPSADEDRQAIEAVVANMVRGELNDDAEPVDAYVAELMTDRLEQQAFECPLVSVSDIIRENQLARVDLLKVDAEKCEREILRGISDEHWPLIAQVVVEVHDRSRRAVVEVQDFLTQRGFQCAVEEENLLTGSGLFNVYARRPEDAVAERAGTIAAESPAADGQNKVDEFLKALGAFASAASMPTILCVCPSGQKNKPGALTEPEWAAMESRLREQAAAFPSIAVIGSEEIQIRYPTASFHDTQANELGHVPYTTEGFAAIGSNVFRKLVGLRHLSPKVIVLDCDNTLWQGVCGEEGPRGVTVTPAHAALQAFMIRQMQAGRLLCLGSKNSEEDVWSVFAQNPGMVLKREHFAAWRINWTPKSENLRSLARELNVSLDDFIFLDDNPVECAEVRAQCPEVLTLQLPAEPARLASFLEHAWVFDQGQITDEDRTRTQKVLENARRENYRGQVATLKDFIRGLQLRVEVFVPTRDQFGRVSQLTQRTNQFNFTTLRRSESDIARFFETEQGFGLAATVSDRFGDYGLVGLLLYRDGGEAYDVDTFLLSCRVLGRGVEHEILAHLGRRAVEHGKQWVNFRFELTPKNQPAWEFIQTVAAEFLRKTGAGATCQFPASTLARLHYDPDSHRPMAGPGETPNGSPSGSSGGAISRAAFSGQSDRFQRIANVFAEVRAICSAMDASRSSVPGAGEEFTDGESPTTLGGKFLRIWRKAIGNSRMGMDDNFFEAGGTSLKAVQVIAALRRELQLQVSIVNLFECPTVRLLCEKFEPGKAIDRSANQAMERGARRKQLLRKRTD